MNLLCKALLYFKVLSIIDMYNNPMAIDIARSDEPPELINGKGIPNTGISPIATPIFIITCVIR